MSTTRQLTRRTRTRVNAIRLRLGVLPIAGLPRGQKKHIQDCAIHRALRGAGLGKFSVYSDKVAVDREFAGLFARTWGTTWAVDDNTPNRALVDLPDDLCAFVKAFDAGDMPELELADKRVKTGKQMVNA